MNSEFEMYEQGNNLIIELEVPGLSSDEIEVFVEGDYLRVEGKREISKEARLKGFYIKEAKSNNFLKQIGLPVNVIGERAKTEFLGNKIIITLPKQ